MDVLPDFTTISDEDLKALIERYVHEEEEVSYRRRLLHGKIDILRAELVDRVKRRHAGEQSSLSEVDIDRLTEILAHRGPPRGDDHRPGAAIRRVPRRHHRVARARAPRAPAGRPAPDPPREPQRHLRQPSAGRERSTLGWGRAPDRQVPPHLHRTGAVRCRPSP